MPVQLRRRPGASAPKTCSSTTQFRVPSTVWTSLNQPLCTGDSSFQVAIENISGSALLFKLPPEVLTMIFDQAPQVDKIMLAMTCKSLLATSRLCGLSVPLRESHVVSWNRPASSSPVVSCSCLNMGDLLRRFRPRDARGRPSRAWSWCLDCCRYLPTRRGWWQRRMRNEPAVVSRDRREPSIDWFSRGVKQQCPICYLKDVQ